MPRLLKALPLTLALAAFGLFSAGCGSSNTAQARFVNAIPDSSDYGNEGLDIDFNGNKVFTNIAFGSFSASTYSSVPSGNPTIAAYETGSTPPANLVFSQNSPTGMGGGSQYTIVATGSATGSGSNVVLLVPTDSNTAPANGNVNFRVINASPSGPGGSRDPVDVYFIANPPPNGLPACAPPICIADLAYESTSAYVTLPINTSGGNGWQMIVTPTGTTSEYMNATIGNFGSSSEGAICTVVITDIQNGDQMSSTPLQLDDLNGCTQ